MKRFALAFIGAFVFGTAVAQTPGAPPSPIGPATLCLTCYTPMTVTSTTTSIALPAPVPPYSAVTIKNNGTIDAFIAIGNSSVTATLASPIVRAGASLTISGAAGNYLAAITASGSTTFDVFQSNAALLLQAPSPVTVNVTPTPSIPQKTSTALEASHSFCLSACTVYSAGWPQCPAGDWAMMFDSPTPPADGSVTPKFYAQVAGNSGLFASWIGATSPMTAGMTSVCSSTGPFTKTGVNSTFEAQAQ